MNIIKKYRRKIRAKIDSYLERDLLKQEAMLRLALREEGLNPKKLDIKIDHVNGYNTVNGIVLPIIYPKSFFKKAEKLHAVEKVLTFYFNGNMSDAGGRKEMLSKFERDDSKLVESDYGRSKYTKKKFNNIYYAELASSKFGLCPHQKDFVGNQETMWTYRFIECCMVLTIPVIFKETPLGEKFINGFYYVDDEEVLSNKMAYDHDKALQNFASCVEKFSLSKDVVLQLKNEIKKK